MQKARRSMRIYLVWAYHRTSYGHLQDFPILQTIEGGDCEGKSCVVQTSEFPCGLEAVWLDEYHWLGNSLGQGVCRLLRLPGHENIGSLWLGEAVASLSLFVLRRNN
ncbi:hypothetical protein HS088_TW17G00838 [Tripterygium wilfordii]|uniref:Uncharacterized protein n=1 Tax=Tripterygium wilfordii TaxID=458696 RepID=A0A7J7CGY5_TRIWF|nr:hypothetical protein HS088_TW17G00838 [Tripterygium wilfordii]